MYLGSGLLRSSDYIYSVREVCPVWRMCLVDTDMQMY
jgi:hypothetical protein